MHVWENRTKDYFGLNTIPTQINDTASVDFNQALCEF